MLIFAGVILVGCDLKDDYSNCRMGVHLSFVYTLNKDYVDKFAEQVSHTDLFVYDENGSLTQSIRVQTAEMKNGKTDIYLLPGKYKIVSWSNLEETDYTVLQVNTLTQMQVQLNTNTENQIKTQQSALFHGTTDIEVKPKYTTEGNIAMTKDVNDIQIILYTDEINESNYSNYSIEITGTNGTYNFDNSKAESKLLKYMPPTGYQPWEENGQNGIKVDLRVMRMFTDDDLRVIIRLGGKAIYNELLTTEILKHPDYNTDEDLDRYDEYTLRFRLKTTGLSLISINDWTLTEQNGGV